LGKGTTSGRSEMQTMRGERCESRAQGALGRLLQQDQEMQSHDRRTDVTKKKRAKEGGN